MRFRWSIALVLLVVVGVLPVGGAGAAGPSELAPAAVVTSVAPRILALGVTTNVVLTGTDFVAGTVFTSDVPTFLINSANVDSATQVTLNVTAPATPTHVGLRATAPGQATQSIAGIFVRGAEGTFFPVTPVRAADTRSGIGGRSTALGPKESFNVSVTGVGAVPAANVAGVVLNVTATDTTSVSFVAIYPAGASFPTVSNLNFGPNQTIPNHVTVGVGTNGQITVYNEAGTVNIIVDVVGYYVTAAGPTGAGYFPRQGNPRVLDTRSGAAIPPFGTLNLTVASAAASGITAAVYNVTVDQPTANGYITVYPSGETRPETSAVNFLAGHAVPNLVTVKIGTNDAVSFYNGSAGTVHLIIDGVGFYTTSPNTFTYIVRPVPGGPFRLWDSRINLGRPLAEHEVFNLAAGPSIPAMDTVGVIANATVTQPSTGGYATVFPGLLPQPPASSLNFAADETRANQVIPALLPQLSRDISIYNDTGTAHFILDVFAYLQGA